MIIAIEIKEERRLCGYQVNEFVTNNQTENLLSNFGREQQEKGVWGIASNSGLLSCESKTWVFSYIACVESDCVIATARLFLLGEP